MSESKPVPPAAAAPESPPATVPDATVKDDAECAAPSKAKTKKPAPTILIIDARCKGCDLCVAACPKDVLAMKGGKAIVVKPDDCNGCMLCELRCPDFAIIVGEVA